MEYSIVIPVYNESDKVVSTLNQVLDFMRGFSKSFEIIIVDDGSTDNTIEIIEEYIKSNHEIRLIKSSHKGKGPSVGYGVNNSHGEFVYMCDADLASPIDELKKLSLWLKEHDYDIVIASREGTGAVRVNEPWYRHFMGRVFNLLVRLLVLPGINDSQCGFKLFKGNVAREIFPKMVVYNSDSKDINTPYLGAFDVEFLYIARIRGYKIKELPVYWKYVRTTRLRPLNDSLKMSSDVIKIRLNGLKGVYK